MQVTRLSEQQWSELSGEWNRLAVGIPFRRHEWLLPWWRVYGRGELLVLAVCDEQKNYLGFAPWFIENSAQQGRVIRALGSGEVCSDYCSLLCRAGDETTVAAALVDYLTDGLEFTWDLCHFEGVDGEDFAMAELTRLFGLQHQGVHRRTTHRCWRAALADTWEQFAAAQSKSHRKQLRRAIARVLESGRGKMHWAECETSLERAWQVLVELHQRRRNSLGQPGCFASPKFIAFHREATRGMLDAGCLRLSWLSYDDRPIAAEYQLAGGGITYVYQAGVEPDCLELEPGRAITIATIQQAIEHGQQAIDFLRGDEPYKAHWRAQPRPAYELRIVSPRTTARVRHGIWLAADGLRSWIKNNIKTAESVYEPV